MQLIKLSIQVNLSSHCFQSHILTDFALKFKRKSFSIQVLINITEINS